VTQRKKNTEIASADSESCGPIKRAATDIIGLCGCTKQQEMDAECFLFLLWDFLSGLPARINCL
jgi:hypothetical protein